MIWSDADILNEIKLGNLGIDPFDEKSVQPASYDVRLGNVFYRFHNPTDYSDLEEVIDPRKPPSMERLWLADVDFVVHPLNPREFILAVTREKITLNEGTIGRIEGKSSLGRLGLSVHVTAGFIDPGFSGYLTLEMVNFAPYPILLIPGMYIAQISFESTRSKSTQAYSKARGSRYTDAGAKCEPTPSRYYLKTGL